MRFGRPLGLIVAVATAGAAGTLLVATITGMPGDEVVDLGRALLPMGLVTVAVAAVLGRMLGRASLRHRFVAVALVAVAVGLANVAVLSMQMFVDRHDASLVAVLLLYATGAGVAAALAASGRAGVAVRRLEDAARRLGRGDLDARVGDLGAGEELDTLGRTLDAMAGDLRRARDDERRTEQMRRDLIATLSHDLRTPLSALRAMIEAVDDGVVGDPDTLRRYAGEMRRSVGQLVDLVDDLFELTQLDVEAIADETRRASLDTVVDSAIGAVSMQAQQKGVGLSAELGEAHDTSCSPRVERVLQNLLSNAVGHTPADGTVRITAHREGGRLRVSVEDDGEGIAAEHLPFVFDPFYRADPARSGPGAGLGLALAKRIVEALGGSISAESRVEVGSRFAVELPVTPSVSA